MTDAPKVSVCVITYNQAKYIGPCLESIVTQQTSFPFEILVGDDGSTDGTRDVITALQERFPQIEAIFQDRNLGPTANHMAVHNRARGEYVCHCDGDDLFLPGKLQSQARILDDSPTISQVWHRQQLISQDSQPIRLFPRRFPAAIYGRPLSLLDLAHSYALVGQHSSQMYRRSARTIRQRSVPTIDYFYALDLALSGTAVHMDRIFGCYREVPNVSMTQNPRGRDVVDQCVIDAALHYAALVPETRAAFRANLTVRAMGARVRHRKYWREMLRAVEPFPFSARSLARSAFLFALFKW
jgi:glycosyltransferase involved in cell wall biosynthesis